MCILVTECIAVNIKRIQVPPLVELGTDSVILDCDYSTGVKPGPGLVIKWFFNGSTGLVYQWIPPRQPQVIGLLKGKVDMTFKISGKLFFLDYVFYNMEVTIFIQKSFELGTNAYNITIDVLFHNTRYLDFRFGVAIGTGIELFNYCNAGCGHRRDRVQVNKFTLGPK